MTLRKRAIRSLTTDSDLTDPLAARRALYAA